jgi:hypothetical protein
MDCNLNERSPIRLRPFRRSPLWHVAVELIVTAIDVPHVKPVGVDNKRKSFVIIFGDHFVDNQKVGQEADLFPIFIGAISPPVCHINVFRFVEILVQVVRKRHPKVGPHDKR